MPASTTESFTDFLIRRSSRSNTETGFFCHFIYFHVLKTCPKPASLKKWRHVFQWSSTFIQVLMTLFWALSLNKTWSLCDSLKKTKQQWDIFTSVISVHQLQRNICSLENEQTSTNKLSSTKLWQPIEVKVPNYPNILLFYLQNLMSVTLKPKRRRHIADQADYSQKDPLKLFLFVFASSLMITVTEEALQWQSGPQLWLTDYSSKMYDQNFWHHKHMTICSFWVTARIKWQHFDTADLIGNRKCIDWL